MGYVEEENYFYYPYVIISASIIPQLLINPRKQKILFWFSILYYFFLTVIIYNVMIKFGDNTIGGNQYTIIDVVRSSRVFYTVSQICVFIFVNVGIYYLRMINFRSEEELNMKNRELDNQNAELKKQKDEIEKHKDDLLQKEINTWQKLVNIISHEIVNSAIPITNLAGMSRQMLEDESGQLLKPELIGEEVSTDIHHSLRVIETRTQALINLVTATKNLTHIPLPAKRNLFIKDLFERILLLHKANFREKGIEFETLVYPPDLCINADLELIEQVIINLIKNSLEALDGIERPEISLTAALDTGHATISVADNGAGISEDIIGQIFIPYFSTKNGNSGIGLSLSRKIMMLHNGRLEVSSTTGKGSSFSLIFPL
jgi:signal transduction histidine kinase